MKLSFKFPLISAFTAAVVALPIVATAQDVTGAGATFPAPLYAKWAADYNRATGIKINYSPSVQGQACVRSMPKPSISARPTCR